MSDGYIDIDVRLNDAQAKSQADKMGKQLGQQISSNVDSASNTADTSTKQAMRNIGSSLEGYGAAMSKAVTIPILAGAAASGAAAIKIDTALTGVRKTVDATEEEYEALKDAAIEFSKTNAVDPAQILDIQALGAQLGYSKDELQMFGEVVSGLDIATNMNAEEAATELAQFANIMGMAHDETENYGATIVELGNNFATTESDISHMSMRIAAAGKQIGMSEADVLGMATALSSMGIEAEAGGTAISTIMSNIDKAVATNSDKLVIWAETAGMSADQFAAAWKNDPVEALSAVLAGMDAATQEGGNMSVMLEELGINAIRQTDTLKRLANNAGMLPAAVETANHAWEENTALTKEVENRNASMASQLQILFNKVQAVAIEVGEPLVNALIDMLEMAEPLIQMLADGAKAFGDLDESGQKAVVMAIAAAAAFGPLTTVVGKLLSGTGKSAERWKEFSDNLKIVTGSIKSTSKEMAAGTATWSKYVKVGEGANAKMMKWDKTTQSYVQTNNKLRASIATSTVGMKAGTIAARTLSTALKTIAPMAAFALIATLIGKITESMQKASERAKNYDKATRGLEAAVNTTTGALKNENSALNEQSNAINSIDFDEFLEKHAQLADTIKETSENANKSASLLDQYSDSISRLADRSDLTEPEIAELKNAVDEVNQATGKSYTVAKDADGAWRVMADGAIVAKDAILDLIQAQQLQIQLEATREKYKSTFAQLQEDAEAVAAQMDVVKQKQDEYNDAVARNDPYAQSYLTALEQEQEKLRQLEDVQGATQSSANRLTEQQNLYNMALRDGASDLTKLVASSVEMQAAIQATGTPLDTFVDNMNKMGISAEQLSGILESEGAEGIQNFANAYKSGSDDLLKWAKQHGVEIPQAYIDGMKSKEGDAKKAVEQINKTVDLTFAEEGDEEESGEQKGENHASGIESTRDTNEQAAKKAAGGAKAGFNAYDDEASTWGYDLGRAFSDGIRAAKELAVGAANLVAGAIAGILGHSIPKDGILRNGGQGEKPWGEHLVQNIASGMVSNRAKASIKASTNEVARQISDDLMAQFAQVDPMGQIEASIGRGMSTASIIANSGGISNTTTTWNINQPIATPDELMRQQRMYERYQLAGSRQ